MLFCTLKALLVVNKSGYITATFARPLSLMLLTSQKGRLLIYCTRLITSSLQVYVRYNSASNEMLGKFSGEKKILNHTRSVSDYKK